MVHSSGRDTHPHSTDEPDRRSAPARWLYRLVALVSALFIFTILVTIAVTMSDPSVPANQVMGDWLDRYVSRILMAEVVAIGVLVAGAFLLDRRESWKRYHREYAEWQRRMQQPSEKNPPPPGNTTGSESITPPGETE